MTPATPRTPADACDSFLPKLCDAMSAMQPDYRTAGLLTLLLWSVVLGMLIRLASAIIRASAALRREADAGALPQDFSEPSRPMSDASIHAGIVGHLPPRPELPASAASARHAGRMQRRQMPQAEPSVGAEPTVRGEPSLVPSGTLPKPVHARPLAATYVNIPSPIPKNWVRRVGSSRVQFVTIS